MHSTASYIKSGPLIIYDIIFNLESKLNSNGKLNTSLKVY